MSAALALAASASAAHAAIAGELEALANQLRRVTVRIHTHGDQFDGVGAGVIWPSENQRIVVTNAHVVPTNRGDAPWIENHEGRIAEGRIVARERRRDLAVLALDASAGEWRETAAIGDARGVRPGELVAALGHPFGVEGALSLGVLHAAPDDEDRWLQADIRLAPGNSGGPLATLDGAVIGVNAMIFRGLGIAVPAEAIERFVARALGSPNYNGP